MSDLAAPVVVVGGGQSGLAAAHVLRAAGAPTVLLEARARTAGSWPDYYDSLTLFSPARYSSLPGMPFPGDPDHYPTRDETAAYLERYAATLDVDLRTGTRVEEVVADGRGFVVRTADGGAVEASGVVAASGSYNKPYLPALDGQDGFAGRVLHVVDYREPTAFAGQRVVVVGGGNSAVQVADELARNATVTLATHAPVQFLPQRPHGQDVHYWTHTTGFDRLPPQWLAMIVSAPLVSDVDGYSESLRDGRYDRRAMFRSLEGPDVVWDDGSREPVDTILLATGYVPNFGYLRGLGALDEHDRPLHSAGISTTHAGLVYLGLEFQRSFASNTLRGVGDDAAFVVPPLLAYARDAPAVIGL